MKLVTKFCKHYNKIMRDVTPQKRVCDTCCAEKNAKLTMPATSRKMASKKNKSARPSCPP